MGLQRVRHDWVKISLSQVISYGVCLSLSDLFHLVWASLVALMLPQMALFHSLLWLSNIPLHICTTSYLSIYLSVGIYIVLMSWLLWIVLLWTQGCMYLFELQFCPGICPGVGLLRPIVVLFLVLWCTSTQFFIVAAPTYIPTKSVGAFFFSPYPSCICYW